MAIQNRRGVYSDFTPTKMVPGELAVVQSGDPNNTSGKAVYAAFGTSGDVKRLATEDDLSKKVNTETGKGLSTNDYTTEEKNKLSGIEAQANKTVIDATLTQTGKAADAKAVGDAIAGVTIETDKTLSVTDAPADAKVVGDELSNVKSDLSDMQDEIDSFEGISDDVKAALLDCFAHVAWIDEHGQDYYDALYEALYGELPPEEDIIAEITADDIAFGYGFSVNNNVYSNFSYSNSKRAAYLGFDISLTPGESYKFTWDDSMLPDSAIGMQILNQVALDKVTSGSSVSFAGDFFDIGWLQNGCVVKIPEAYNSSPMTVIRLAFKANAADSLDMTDGSIGWVKIVRDTDTIDADKVRIIPKDELLYRVGILNTPPYYSTYERPERICYWKPIDVTQGATYIVKFEKSSSYPNAQIGIDVYNKNAIDSMDQNIEINNSDMWSSGWMNTNSEFTIPQTINNSLPKGMRLSFRANASNSNFTSSDAIHYVFFIKAV